MYVLSNGRAQGHAPSPNARDSRNPYRTGSADGSPTSGLIRYISIDTAPQVPPGRRQSSHHSESLDSNWAKLQAMDASEQSVRESLRIRDGAHGNVQAMSSSLNETEADLIRASAMNAISPLPDSNSLLARDRACSMREGLLPNC